MSSESAADRMIACLRRHITDLDRIIAEYERFQAHESPLSEDAMESLIAFDKELNVMNEEMRLLAQEYRATCTPTPSQRETIAQLATEAEKKAIYAMSCVRSAEQHARESLAELTRSIGQLKTGKTALGGYQAGTQNTENRFDFQG